MSAKQGDLSVTALYTSAVWSWGKLPYAYLFSSKEGQWVFNIVNVVLKLARPFFTRLPSLKHSLLHRHVIIDHLLGLSQAHCVLELASGLSRRGVSFTTNPQIDYVEVDLPHVVERKRQLLLRSDQGRRALSRPNWKMVAGDASMLKLADIAPGSAEDPLFVIIEGLFMYLDAEAQRALFREVAAYFRTRPSGTLVFDLVPVCEQPRPGVIGKVLEWLMKRSTGGQAFDRDPRTRKDISEDLKKCGFDEIEILEPQSVAASFRLPFPKVRTQQIVFVARSGVQG